MSSFQTVVSYHQQRAIKGKKASFSFSCTVFMPNHILRFLP